MALYCPVRSVAPFKAVLVSPPGYLGYTSGLSLLCMIFFLIVVGVMVFVCRKCILKALSGHPALLTSAIFCCQVICKKFQIPCPVEAALMANETVNGTFTQAALAALASNSTSADTCRPRYFIFNSQVIGCSPVFWKENVQRRIKRSCH